MIGSIERVDLREVWRHEALDFTTWLEGNIDVLNEVLGTSLASPEREKRAGDLNVDLLAEDADSKPVVIENQLSKSDHSHLGKLLTYLTVLGAETAIWIVADPRPEHVRAIAWLNESSAASFYLVKVEAIRIGNSPPAPWLTLIVGPSEESREVGEAKRDMAERYVLRQQFWTGLLERAKAQTHLHAAVSAGRDNALSTGAGTSGLTLTYLIRQHDAQVHLWIDRGAEAQDENRRIYDALHGSRVAIEDAFKESLDWLPPLGRRSAVVRKQLDIGGYREPRDKWPEIQDAMIDAMIRLEGALRPHIDKLDM
jgi:hypothetical protein